MQLKSTSLSLFLLFTVFCVGYGMSPDQPFMTAARADLQRAKSELKIAEHNKGGHRAKALQYVNTAIAEINKGIAFDRRNNHAQGATIEEIFSSTIEPDQPHMRAALDHLRNAKTKLEKATADKGGHRAKAIDLINQAIAEANLGIAAAS